MLFSPQQGIPLLQKAQKKDVKGTAFPGAPPPKTHDIAMRLGYKLDNNAIQVLYDTRNRKTGLQKNWVIGK